MNRKRLLALVFVSGAIVGAAFGSSASRLSEVYGHALPADLKPGTHVTILRQIDGEKAVQWHHLRVYRGANDRVAAPKGSIWELTIEGGSHVLLVEDQPE